MSTTPLSTPRILPLDASQREMVRADTGVAEFTAQVIYLPASPPEAFAVVLDVEGVPATLLLARHAMFAPDVRFLIDRGGGQIVSEELPPVHTYRGIVSEHSGSHVAATWDAGRLRAVVHLAQSRWQVIPVPAGIDLADRSAHLVFKEGGLAVAGGVCFNEDHLRLPVLADPDRPAPRGDRERFPAAKPRIISDNGPQFIARDFQTFIRICGMTHARTSPYYPQSNGKLERWHGSLKRECIRPGTPLSLEDTRRLVGRYVEHYNEVWLHSAIGYVMPRDRLEGRQQGIWDERDRKLSAARQRPKTQRQAASAAAPAVQSKLTGTEDRATLGSDPSADSGARTDGRAAHLAARYPVIRFGTNAINPRREVEKPFDTHSDVAGVT